MRGRHRRALRLALFCTAIAVGFGTAGTVALALAAGDGDETPPAETVPAPPSVTISGVQPTYESGPDGATVSFTVSAVDSTGDPIAEISCDPSSGTAFPLGPHSIVCSVTDKNGDIGSAQATFTVQDTTAPSVTMSGLQDSYEASGPNGVSVSFDASADDVVDAQPSVSCTADSGDTFPLGAQSITCTATDASGNKGTRSVAFVVQDTTDPVVTISGVQQAYESGPKGATVTFAPSATDKVDGQLDPDCNVSSPFTASLGNHSIVCSAKDRSGNEGTRSVAFVVQDKTDPVVTISGVRRAYDSGPNGATVIFTASATDNVDGQLDADCKPSSPFTALPGNHSIICSSTDRSGNTGAANSDFMVKDPKAPTVTISGVQPTYESGAKGARVIFTTSAVDANGEPIAKIGCDSPSGTTFALGAHSIVCSATDSLGNSGTDTAPFKVQDTTPPVLPNLPDGVTIYANTPSGATDAQATLNDLADTKATDIVDPGPKVTFSPSIGFLPVGVTVITVTATDSSGNSSSQKITFEVKPMPAPASPEAKQARSPPRLDTAPPPNPTGFKSVVGEKFVTISWGSVADAKEYVVIRSGGTQLAAARDTVVYEGPATTFTDRGVKKGADYRYVVAAVDAAGNRSAGVVITVTPRAVYLVKPPNGLRVTRGRVDFRWAPVHGAGYYNLQLYRQTGRRAQAAAQGTKVLSTWPPKARYSLASSWKYKGKRYALRPGSYVWYIWPGFGSRAKAKYGDLLGQSVFVVTKPRN